MPAQWMEAFFGKKRMHKIKDSDLAAEIGWHPKYLSAVLNGHRTPKGAEEKLNKALDTLISERQNHTE